MPAPVPPRRARVRAPRLSGRRWLGTGGGAPDLRGRVVLLDFFTGSCVNCVHVLPELRALGERFGGELAVVGVHSPKFPHEAAPGAVETAVARLGLDHPVLDDAELRTWSAFAVRAWPTLVVLTPDGYVAATFSGEGHGEEVAGVVADLLRERDAAGPSGVPAAAPAPAPGPAAVPEPAPGVLRFPSRALALPGGTVLVADSGHARLVELAADLATPLRALGGFTEPQGLALLPPGVAAEVGYDVVVADRGAHALRGVRLADGHVRTVAGTGRQLRRRSGGGPALQQELSSPWDVAWFDGQVLVAMAGSHQLWAFEPAADPARAVVRVVAGTTAEGLRDGPAESAWLAQPSGLAVQRTGTGEVAWFVDAETSALRALCRTGPVDRAVPMVRDERMANVEPVARPGHAVTTAVGTGLFDFGLRDGPGAQGPPERRALLQHPLGVAVAPDGSVLVADTYNGALRRLDPSTGLVSTLAEGLAEPADVLVLPGAGPDGPALVVVESAAHRLVRLPLPRVLREPGAVQRAEVALPPGRVRLEVSVRPPDGQELDASGGPAAVLDVAAAPASLLRTGAGAAPGLLRELELDGAPGGGGVLHLEVRVATCDADGGPGAACHLHRRALRVPVRTDPAAAALLRLDVDLGAAGAAGGPTAGSSPPR
ncbi:thioredoxin-like domain-containing protein [Kineococcus gypseus]|uniref:thioredoxin-like domain-containing protein n=1 Tax=Kineococcus gypseus TaxID=1637102 RepID=UPI003D7CFAE9